MRFSGVIFTPEVLSDGFSTWHAAELPRIINSRTIIGVTNYRVINYPAPNLPLGTKTLLINSQTIWVRYFLFANSILISLEILSCTQRTHGITQNNSSGIQVRQVIFLSPMVFKFNNFSGVIPWKCKSCFSQDNFWDSHMPLDMVFLRPQSWSRLKPYY